MLWNLHLKAHLELKFCVSTGTFPLPGITPLRPAVLQGCPPSPLGFWVTRGLLLGAWVFAPQWHRAGVIWLKLHRCFRWFLSPLAITLGHRCSVWTPFVDANGLPRLDPVLGYMETIFCSLCLAGFSSQSIYIIFKGSYVLKYVYTLFIVSVILELERRRAVWTHVAIIMGRNLPCPPTALKKQLSFMEGGLPWCFGCYLS